MSLVIDRTRSDVLKVRFTVDGDVPEGPVSVVGTFNDWVPGLDELVPDRNGTRSVTVGLPYGQEIVFRYLGAAGTWADEPDADAITDQGSVLHAIDPAVA